MGLGGYYSAGVLRGLPAIIQWVRGNNKDCNTAGIVENTGDLNADGCGSVCIISVYLLLLCIISVYYLLLCIISVTYCYV